MQDLLYPLLAAVLGYLIGSLSFAVIISRAMGLGDPRSYGSGNPGATNVLRSGNKVAAILTLMLDALKAYVPVLLVLMFGKPYGMVEGTAALVGLTAFLGHVWPVFFRFKGGKGVATAIGMLLAINPLLGAATLLTWAIIVYFSRYVSLASIVSAVFAPFYQMLIWGGGPEVLAIGLMSVLLIWRHEDNIAKLFKGTENKLGRKVAVPPSGTSHKHPHGQGHEARGHSHHHAKKKGGKS